MPIGTLIGDLFFFHIITFSGLALIAIFYYAYKLYRANRHYNKAATSGRYARGVRGRVRDVLQKFGDRMNRFTLLYFSLILVLLLFLGNAIVMFEGSVSFVTRADGSVTHWSMWVVLAIASGLYSLNSIYIKKLPAIQMAFLVIFSVGSMACLLVSTRVDTMALRIAFFAIAGVSAFLATCLFVFPDNYLFRRYSNGDKKHSYLRTMYTLIAIIGYTSYYVIFLLSSTNQMLFILNLHAELVLYTVNTVLLVLLTAWVLLREAYTRMYTTMGNVDTANDDDVEGSYDDTNSVLLNAAAVQRVTRAPVATVAAGNPYSTGNRI